MRVALHRFGEVAELVEIDLCVGIHSLDDEARARRFQLGGDGALFEDGVGFVHIAFFLFIRRRRFAFASRFALSGGFFRQHADAQQSCQNCERDFHHSIQVKGLAAFGFDLLLLRFALFEDNVFQFAKLLVGQFAEVGVVDG